MTSSLTKLDVTSLTSLSLKKGSSLNFVKFGIKPITSFLNESKFDKFSFLSNFFNIKLNIFQSSNDSPIG